MVFRWVAGGCLGAGPVPLPMERAALLWMEEYCCLYGKNGRLMILIPGALCRSVQVVTGVSPALIVYLLFKGESKPGSRPVLRGGGVGGLILSHDAEVAEKGCELTRLQLILL